MRLKAQHSPLISSMSTWYCVILFKVTSDCGNFDAKLYSLPMGEKTMARDPEKEEPETSRAAD
jgi:hypothetical protein